MPGAVVERFEADPVAVDLRGIAEAEDLETAGIGENGPIPAHELVQPTRTRHHTRARPEIQVIGVRQDNAGARLRELPRRQGFDRRPCAHRHEAGSLHHTVGRG